jgi:hypothetical protein
VVALTFAQTALPRLLGADEDEGVSSDQMRLTDYGVSTDRSVRERVRNSATNALRRD